MMVKRYLPVRLTVLKPSCCLYLLVLIAILFLPPCIATGEEKVSKAKSSVKKKTTSTAKTLRIKDISFHIEEGKESFIVFLNRVYKPKVRYIKGASIHVVMVFIPVVDFVEKDYSKVIAGSKYVKQLRSYYDSKTNELRFVLDTNGTADYSIAPANGGSGNIFTIVITEAKSVKSEEYENEDSLPSDLLHETSFVL
jgi:hypothetical protein